jgi:hypothetical protein
MLAKNVMTNTYGVIGQNLEILARIFSAATCIKEKYTTF